MTLRGTIILADNIYRTVEGKWIISGTYNKIICPLEAFTPTWGLNFYVRILVEHAGLYDVHIKITDSSKDPREPEVLIENNSQITVRPSEVPVHEAMLKFDGISLRCPVLPDDRVPNQMYIHTCCFRLGMKAAHETEWSSIGETPLEIAFVRPML